MVRPIKYDFDKVLEAAMHTFWQRGYGGTSVEHLTEATQLGKGSLYNIFGGKRDLYIQALHYYGSNEVTAAISIVNSGKAPRDALRILYGTILTRITDHADRRGCLLCNTSLDIGISDGEISGQVRQCFEPLLKALSALLQKAGLPNSDAEIQADFLFTIYTGLQVMSRGGYSTQILEATIEHTVSQLPSELLN